MSDKQLPVVDVAVAVVQRSDGRVLLAERPLHKVSGGYWEFPGGKFNAGENPAQALARELHEEIGVELDVAHRWLTYQHTYPDKVVRLHFFRVTAWHGTPRGNEGQRVSWEDPYAPRVSPLLPANDNVLRALRLAPVYAITDATKYGIPDFIDRFEHALEAGLRLVLIRERTMAPEQLAQFARQLITRARPYGADVLIEANESIARKVGADGIQILGHDLRRLDARPNVRIVAVSCHNAAELAQAAKLGADFVLLSPVLSTPTHPDRPGMGWDRFADMVRDYPLPVFALGGMKTEMLPTAVRHGAHGLAIHAAFWGNGH